jgi:hypothetical protein
MLKDAIGYPGSGRVVMIEEDDHGLLHELVLVEGVDVERRT